MLYSPKFFKNLEKSYHYLVQFGGFFKSPLLLICRLFWGWQFLQAGLEKSRHIEDFANFLYSLNFPLPLFHAYLASYTEIIGGFCLIIGFASRLVSIPLIITMITAYFTVHVESIKSLFIDPSLFVAQTPFNFLLILLFIFAFGPGRFSIDYILEKWLFQTA